jgi:hypothetical protein
MVPQGPVVTSSKAILAGAANAPSNARYTRAVTQRKRCT